MSIFLWNHAYGADHKVQIVFAGTTFAGGDFKTIKREFSNLNSNPDDREELRTLVQQKIKKHNLPFDLINISGLNKKKEYVEIENPLSFTVLITRATLFKDIYRLKIKGTEKEYFKYYFDVGLSAIFFTPAANKDKIEYSIPVIAEDILLGDFRQDQIKKQFLKTYERALDILFKRIEKLNPRKVKAKVVKVTGRRAQINAGKEEGVLQGYFIKFKRHGEGQVIKVKKHSADIEIVKGELKKNDIGQIEILKSEEDETYQVIDVEIISKNAKKLFGKDNNFKVLCAQWFSDYLSDRGGAMVLPPKAGAAYTVDAKRSLISAYGLEGDRFNFEIAGAKNPIILTITGLNKKMVKGSSINQIWIYKAWVEGNTNGKKREVDEFIKEEVIVGVKELDDYQVFREVIQQTLAKLAIN
jgi:hypothetical protein